MAADVPEGETQSIYAWSQSNDDGTNVVVAPQRRSWKIPAAVAALAAAAAVTVGVVVQEWPRHSAPAALAPVPLASASQAARPAPAAIPSRLPAKATDPDSRFVALMKAQGLETGTDAQVAGAGRQVCQSLTDGPTFAQVVNGIVYRSGVTHADATKFAEAAIDVYCPQYSSN